MQPKGGGAEVRVVYLSPSHLLKHTQRSVAAVDPITHIEVTIRGSPAHYAIAIAGSDTGDAVHFPENRGGKDHGRLYLGTLDGKTTCSYRSR